MTIEDSKSKARMDMVFKKRPLGSMSAWCLALCAGILIVQLGLHEAAHARQGGDRMKPFRGTKCEKSVPPIVSNCNFLITLGVPLSSMDCCRQVLDACPPIFCSAPGYASCKPDKNWCKRFWVPDWQRFFTPNGKSRLHLDSYPDSEDDD